MARAVVLLPQPDSPTRPSVSPCWTVKLTPSTARTKPCWRFKSQPREKGKWTWRLRTSRRGLARRGGWLRFRGSHGSR